ncbi:hypothetical protein GE09DRAFT_1283107 [Coniochaeta sp. 2T2.1]|nr:hypothetical protein GE09DRAFT_1283107 [Coniochaeta sp. 2T2.1]
MEGLYTAALRLADLYKTGRRGKSVWEMIAERASLHATLGAADAVAAMAVITDARRNYKGVNDWSTTLTMLADRYIKLEAETEAAEEHWPFMTPLGDGEAPSRELTPDRAGIIKDMVKTLREMDITTLWPPAHFSVTEVVALADARVVPVLGGVNNDNPHPRQPIKDIDSLDRSSEPRKLQISLCNLALRTAKVAYLASGLEDRRQLRPFSTIPHFLAYARKALVVREKAFVIGMFVEASVANVIVLRPLTPDCKKLQVLVFDPSFKSEVIKCHDMVRHSSFRNDRYDAFEKWAESQHLELETRYVGGYVPEELVSDSVRAGFEFIKYLTLGGGLAELPAPHDEPGFTRQRFTSSAKPALNQINMPQLSYIRKAALRQPGLYFHRSNPFPDIPEKVRARVLKALIGEVPNIGAANFNTDVVKKKAVQGIKALFRAVLDNADLYRELQGSSVVWALIANEAALYHPLTGKDTKTAVEVITRGRLEYKGKENPVTALTTLVDQYIALTKEESQISTSAPVGDISEGHKIMRALTNKLNKLDLTTSPSWPPSYFSAKEMLLFAQQHVFSALRGVDSVNREPRQPLPDVNSYDSPPRDIQIALCNLALVHCTPNKGVSLFLKPVGILCPKLHHDWYWSYRREIGAFSTMPKFLSHAKTALFAEGKTYVIGLFTYWNNQDYATEPTNDTIREDPSVWRKISRRYGSVIVFRALRLPDGDQLQMISYEPSYGSKAIKDQLGRPGIRSTPGSCYQRERSAVVKEWLSSNGIRLHSRYYGGRVPGEFAADSLRASIGFIEGLVSSREGEEVFPHFEDSEGWQKLGFIPLGSKDGAHAHVLHDDGELRLKCAILW